jgi:hypothetical protein
MTDTPYDPVLEKTPRTPLAIESNECGGHECVYEPRGTQTHGKPLQLLKRRLRRPRKLTNMIWTLMARQAIDIVLWATFVAVIQYTTTVDFLNKTEKYYFNAISVGLPLTMGLNYNASFKCMASMMRWKILASDKFELKEVSRECGEIINMLNDSPADRPHFESGQLSGSDKAWEAVVPRSTQLEAWTLPQQGRIHWTVAGLYVVDFVDSGWNSRPILRETPGILTLQSGLSNRHRPFGIDV